MRYLNVGCGNNYIKDNQWINIDFFSTDKHVISHNLLKGIPFDDRFFDMVYCSHVLEHFTKLDGNKLIKECFRVLRPGGVLRVVVPDLEAIAKEYLDCLNNAVIDPNDAFTKANYEWILLEMYDQTVRNVSGGEMGKYLLRDQIINEKYILSRIGEEGRLYKNGIHKIRISTLLKRFQLISVLKILIKEIASKLQISIPLYEYYKIGRFRSSGEIHFWMYDRFSLGIILKSNGGTGIRVRDAFTSYIINWADFCLDGKDNVIRKPDSLFIEAIK